MSVFEVGYAEVNINPPLGIGIWGYYVPRFAKGILDDVGVRAIAFSMGQKRFVMISADLCAIPKEIYVRCAEAIEKTTGLSGDNVLLAATHTHTNGIIGESTSFEADEEVIRRYEAFFVSRVADAAKLAFDDLKPAKMGYAVGHAPDRTSYIRRYKMKDGSTMTCPPINNPDIDYPIGELDKRVNVLRFDREGAETVVLVNYGLHADTVNGELISADWPGWMISTVEKAIDNVKCVFFSGAAGDVGSTNVNPSGGDMNDTEISFDNEMKSPGMARFVGRAFAGTVLQVFDKVEYIDVDGINILHRPIKVPANVPAKEDMPRAHEYKKLHEEGRDDLIPYTAMELTTVVAEALRMCALENGPEEFVFDLLGIQIGNVAFVGMPGEAFTDVGVGIKDTEGWDLILLCALVNAYEGYFPMQSAYDEGGYEARTSRYKAGVAERIIEGGKQVLCDLKLNR